MRGGVFSVRDQFFFGFTKILPWTPEFGNLVPSYKAGALLSAAQFRCPAELPTNNPNHAIMLSKKTVAEIHDQARADRQSGDYTEYKPDITDRISDAFWAPLNMLSGDASGAEIEAAKQEVYPDFPGHRAGMPVKPAIPENRVATQSLLSRRAGH